MKYYNLYFFLYNLLLVELGRPIRANSKLQFYGSDTWRLYYLKFTVAIKPFLPVRFYGDYATQSTWLDQFEVFDKRKQT